MHFMQKRNKIKIKIFFSYLIISFLTQESCNSSLSEPFVSIFIPTILAFKCFLFTVKHKISKVPKFQRYRDENI